MKHHLNYSKEDPNYILLGKIFKIIGSRKSNTLMASKGIKNVNMMILSIKIVFIAIFFNTTMEFVVQELKRDKRLRKFFEISEVPDALQISEFLGRFDSDTYVKIVNSILLNYIGFKATIVIEQDSALPVAIIIHSGAPHDSRIFSEIMTNLQKRRIIRKNDTIIFDRDYYSYKNYQIGISKYKIVPLIFPKENFKIQQLKDKLTYPLRIFNNKNTNKKTISKIKNRIIAKNK